MNCYFCNNWLNPVIDPAGAKSNDPNLFDYYHCKKCKASFKECQGKITDWFLNYKHYRAQFSLEENKFKLYSNPAQGRMIRVMELNHLPDITPDNFPYKIPTLITFS